MNTFFTKLLTYLGRMFSIELLLKTIKLPSAILLIIANLIPIFGVVVLKWNPFDIVFLYWFESIVIGIFNFLRLLLAKGKIEVSTQQVGSNLEKPVSDQVTKLQALGFSYNIFYAFFFAIHYGIFTVVHGVFLSGFVILKSSFVTNKDFIPVVAFFIALMISHGFSFIYNYVGKKEYLQTNINKQMFAPYGRIVILQFTIILGLMISLIAPSYLIIVFIIIKTLFDLSMHLKVHTDYHPD